MIRTAIKFGMFVAVCLLFTVYLAVTIGNTTSGGSSVAGPTPTPSPPPSTTSPACWSTTT